MSSYIDPVPATSPTPGQSSGVSKCGLSMTSGPEIVQTEAQRERLQALFAALDQLRPLIQKLLAEVKKHPKNLALWLELAGLTSKGKMIGKELSKESVDPNCVMSNNFMEQLGLLDGAVSGALSSGMSLANQDLTNIHLKEANEPRPSDNTSSNNTPSADTTSTNNTTSSSASSSAGV